MIVSKEDVLEEDNSLKILGYFTTSTKIIKIPDGTSKGKIRKLDGLDKEAKELNCYLIGQLAKNDKHKNLIKGEDILNSALEIIYKCHGLIGMRVILIECENKNNLISFYEKNNFQLIGVDKTTQLLQFVTTVSKPSSELNNISIFSNETNTVAN